MSIHYDGFGCGYYRNELDDIADAMELDRASDKMVQDMYTWGGSGYGCHSSSWGKIWEAVQDYKNACYNNFYEN